MGIFELYVLFVAYDYDEEKGFSFAYLIFKVHFVSERQLNVILCVEVNF